MSKAFINPRSGKVIMAIFLFLTAACLIISSFTIESFAYGGSVTVPITFTSVVEGQTVPTGTVRITGTYNSAFNLSFIANACVLGDCHTDDPNGDESGTWYFDLDTTQFDGNMEITVKGYDSSTRYNVWSPFITISVNNPNANIPVVAISSPYDGGTVCGIVPVTVSAVGSNTISSVEVRINFGEWSDATASGSNYVYNWDTAGISNKTCSIEARAVDSKGNTGTSLTTYVKIGTGTNEPLSVIDQDRAVWIWEPWSYPLFLQPSTRDVLDSWAKDTTFSNHVITTLYVAVEQLYGKNILAENPGALRDFNSWAHSRGYKVHALVASGNISPAFGAYERYQDYAVKNIEKIINFNISSDSDECFDGVNVDVEPYLLPDFETSKPDVQIQYLDMLSRMISRRDTAGIDLLIGPAVPRWYDTSTSSINIPWNGTTKSLSEHVQDIADYIAIMDYVDSGDRLVDDAANEIAYGNAIGKPNSVLVGVETQAITIGGDPETITFQEEGRTYLESSLEDVYAGFGTEPSFGGVVWHHYRTRMLPSVWGLSGTSWTPPADTTPPGALSSGPVASAFDFQRIDLSYGGASDNIEVAGYYVYRSTVSGFMPSESNLAGFTYKRTFSDIGLLPDTTYYYKVCAVDNQGNLGPVSSQTSATTGASLLKPMIISQASIEFDGKNATFELKIVDKDTGIALNNVQVHGRFTFMGGKIVDTSTDRNGTASFSSEDLVAVGGGKVGFNPERIISGGYYWAKAYDTVKSIEIEW